MSDAIFCGIDIGTSNVKVILIDEAAKTVWSKSIPVPRVADDGGIATDAATLVSVIEQLIIDGWTETNGSCPISSIAITGIGEDGVPVNEALEPLDLAIPWFDTRAEYEAIQIREKFPDEIRGGVAIDASRTAAKWLWLRNHRPQVMSSAATWISLTDFPAVFWSQTPFISDTLAARTGCFNVFNREWIPALLDASGAPPLPPVKRAGTIVGTVVKGRLIDSGVATKSTYIVVGGHDHPIAASAVRRLNGNAVVDSLGTANLIYAEAANVKPTRNPYLAYSVPVLNTNGISCLGVFEFASFLEPFKTLSNGDTLRVFLSRNRIPGQVSSLESIKNSLQRLLAAKDSMETVTDASNLRAALEAACFYAKGVLGAIQEADINVPQIYCVGGWSRSTAFLELRASIFGQSIVCVDENELTALGAALLARDAGTNLSDIQLFQRNTIRVNPLPEWEEIYQNYWLSIKDHVRPMK